MKEINLRYNIPIRKKWFLRGIVCFATVLLFTNYVGDKIYSPHCNIPPTSYEVELLDPNSDPNTIIQDPSDLEIKLRGIE